MIQLRLIRDEDIAEIKNWPVYVDGFEQMDYALRENGWLDEFRDRPNTWIYIAELNNQATGFSLLSLTERGEAEFRIALHPHRTGQGIGRQVALATLATGFWQLNLESIHLIVRKNNPRAAKLYEGIGFVKTGESIHAVRGRRIEFIDMTMSKDRFAKLKFEEDV